MRAVALAGALAAAIVAFLATGPACNSGTDRCPAAEGIHSGASCSDDHLQCPYLLTTPTAACDGTVTNLWSSCTCTNGTWACPDPIACDAGVADASDEAAP